MPQSTKQMTTIIKAEVLNNIDGWTAPAPYDGKRLANNASDTLFRIQNKVTDIGSYFAAVLKIVDDTELFVEYFNGAAFDLQAYVDSRSEEEKVRLFKLLGDYLQEKEADAMWLKDHDSYPYSTEFMAWYVSNHYVALIDSLFKEPAGDDGCAEIVFTYTSGRTRQVETISNWMAMPYDYLLKMTMKANKIDPKKVQEHILVG